MQSDTNANDEVDEVDDEDEYNPNVNDSKSDEHDSFLDAKYDDLDDTETQASGTSVSNHVEVSLTTVDKHAYESDHDWMPDNLDNAITASYPQHKKNNDDGTYHVYSPTSSMPPPTTNKKPCPPRQLDISSFTTQNAHGLHCHPCNIDGNIIPHGPHDYMRYEHLITSMKTKNLDVYFIQETWLEGNVFDEVINVFRHNEDLGNHNFHGVAIILSPQYYEGWKAAGATPPITTNATGEFLGRYISITVKLDSHDKQGKRVQGNKEDKLMTLLLASIYHPCTKTGSDNIYMRFLDTLDNLLNQLPQSELIIGADINANIRQFNNMSAAEFGPTLGPHGFQKRNSKGESLLAVYLGHRLQVMNTFFPGKPMGQDIGRGLATNLPKTDKQNCTCLMLL